MIDVPDDGEEGEDGWQDIGPINVTEAKAYKEKVDEIFDTLLLMLNVTGKMLSL